MAPPEQYKDQPPAIPTAAAAEDAQQSKTPEQPSPGPQTAHYRAPYYPHPAGAVKDNYIVSFHPGHTVAAHLAFVGRDFALTELDAGYFAELDGGLFDAVRGDPGVEFIEDDVVGERDG